MVVGYLIRQQLYSFEEIFFAGSSVSENMPAKNLFSPPCNHLSASHSYVIVYV